MIPSDYRLYDTLNLAARTVAERSGECYAAARDAASAYALGASPEGRQAIGLLLNAAGDARFRFPEQSVGLSIALNAHATAALTAMSGDRSATVRSLAAAALTVPDGPLSVHFGRVRNEICELARNAEVAR